MNADRHTDRQTYTKSWSDHVEIRVTKLDAFPASCNKSYRIFSRTYMLAGINIYLDPETKN